MTLSEAKEIAKTIHEYVEEKRQEPTGNQNCLLCVWCSEARFRGFRVLPRPVYSPRDSIFKHHEHGLDIVHDAVKESISSIDDIKKKCVNDARYYCHVNWKDSKGGHEFLLIVINDGIYVMDSQANTVAPITSEDGEYYFNDINWDNSFIARIDDKKLNKSLLFRENSMMKVLPWDEEADVKFLIDNGMVSSELTLPEGISIRKAIREDIEYVYECELETFDQEEIQKQEKRNEIMEDAKDSIEHTQIIMRGSNKIGIYQAYKTNQYGMKQEPYDWWYIAEIYIEPAYRSMGIGSALIKRDIEIHGKIMLHVLLSNKRAIKLYESLGFEKDQENGYGGLIMRIDKSKVIKEAYDYSGDMKLPDGVGFRRATENDVSDIYTWRLEAIAKRLRDNEQVKQYVMDDTKRHLEDAYIITYNGKDVGVYVGYKIDDGWWYISTIHILKEYRGQGIGSAIMRRDCACRNKICLRVDPHNTRARKFYKSLGFRVTDKSNKASYVMRYEKGKRPRHVQESYQDEHRNMIKVDNFKYNKVYYGAIKSGEKHRKLSSPLFVTPYIGIASIFASRENLWPELRKRGVIGETNLDYDEWRLPEKDLNKIFRIVHVTVQVPSSNTACKTDVEPFEIKLKGYVHTVDTTDLKDDIYQYKWMDKTREYLIDVPEIDIENVEEIETRYIVTVKRMTKEQDERYQSRHKSKPVQEQVIPDVINDMIPILKSSEYGIGYKGKLITDPTNADYNEKWHCLSPEEFLEYHGGVCYDYVEWEADYLKKHDIKFKKFHISYHVGFDKNDPGEDASTHSICVAIVDGKYIYIEGSSKRLAKKMNYVKEFDDLDKLLDFAVENMQHDPKQNKLMIIDYTNVKGFIGWNVFGYQGKIFSEGKVIRSDFTQEQYIGESYRDEHHNKLYFHLSPDSYLDGQVFKPRVPEYLDRYDPEDKNFENDTTPRVCLSPSIEGCLNGIMVNMPRVNVMPAKSTRFYVYIPEKPFHEYKHKTNKELIRDKDIFDASVTQEVWILEPVRMKLYGVIEIDSVTNVKRKQNVPTVSGKKSTRPYYKYKWHWLVKPKVLEKGTKFDYSVPRVIELLCMDLPKFRYGLIRDGRLQTGNVSESDYDKYWVVHSPEEIDEAGGGNCWDMVEWEAGYLESYGVKYNKYFLSMEHNKKLSTHTFIVVKDHGKFIYIEQAFKRVVDEIGNSKEFDKLEDIFDYVIEASMEFDNMKECNYGIWDYTDIKFKVGTPAKNFMDYIITNGENVYEGNKSNKEGDSK